MTWWLVERKTVDAKGKTVFALVLLVEADRWFDARAAAQLYLGETDRDRIDLQKTTEDVSRVYRTVPRIRVRYEGSAAGSPNTLCRVIEPV